VRVSDPGRVLDSAKYKRLIMSIFKPMKTKNTTSKSFSYAKGKVSLASVLTYDAVELVCIEANVGWVVVSSQGNITVT